MPWTVADVDRFNKGLSDKQKRQWVSVANSTLSECLKKGNNRKSCEGKAVRVANGVVKKETSDKELYEMSDIQECASQEECDNGKDKFVARVIKAVKEFIDPPASDFYVWKEANGRMRWIARYSNNFRDDDHPREIISEKSHQGFVQLVDEKQADYPTLWIWHVPDLKFGVADWVAYDDIGFSMASGYIDEGSEDVANWVASQKDVRLSHGMPKDSIERDPDDPTIITAHRTVEISVLPREYAANPYTGFAIIKEKEDDDMSIPTNKIRTLIDKWNANPELLEELQQRNAEDAEKAREEDREQKEVEAVAEEEAVVEAEEIEVEEEAEVADEETEEEKEIAEETETIEEDEEKEKEEVDEMQLPPSREEVAEAFASFMKPYVETVKRVEEKLDGFVKELGEFKEEEQAKVEKTVANTPTASVAALIAKQMSAVGDDETKVDNRTSLAKSKPKETKSDTYRTGIPFIDDMLHEEPES